MHLHARQVINSGQKKLTTNNKDTSNKQTGMYKVPLETQQSEIVANNILAQTTKPELEQYLHAAIFILTTTILLKATKLYFLKTCTGLIEGLIKKHLYILSTLKCDTYT